MKFEERFKAGDIICSDRFRDGKCMVVAELNHSAINQEYKYTCDDLVIYSQKWSAYERDSVWGVEYGWRIATDDDIVNYLSRFVKHDHKLGYLHITISDEGMSIGQLYLDANQLADLGNIINKYVRS